MRITEIGLELEYHERESLFHPVVAVIETSERLILERAVMKIYFIQICFLSICSCEIKRSILTLADSACECFTDAKLIRDPYRIASDCDASWIFGNAE